MWITFQISLDPVTTLSKYGKMSDKEAKTADQDAKKPPILMDFVCSHDSATETPTAKMAKKDAKRLTKRAKKDAKRLTKRAKKKCCQALKEWVMDSLELQAPLRSSLEETEMI